MYKLYARPGWGSALVEAQLAWYGLPFAIDEVEDLF
jgi:GST-like protein